MQQSDSDFQIPAPPKKGDQAAPPAPPPAGGNTQSPGGDPGSIVPVRDPEIPGLGNNQIFYGVGISLALAVLFWFVGRMLTDTLVKQFAEVGSAKRAGLTLFVFLTVAGAFATFGFLGDFWQVLEFWLPAALLTAVTFFIFLFGLFGALRSRRG
jgi:hypothetical protein